ncbi:MAG: hypothetical protein DDT22_00254 [candidate division WS2 bacterium]|nr:hypothetical protein [Candidatus Lithacetigena glycinireducens]
MFTERTRWIRQETRHITPSAVRGSAVRPEPRMSVVEPKPRVLTSILNTAFNTATELALTRRRIKLEHAKAATARAEAVILPPTLQPPERQEFPWTFILLGGGALMLVLFLSKRK